MGLTGQFDWGVENPVAGRKTIHRGHPEGRNLEHPGAQRLSQQVEGGKKLVAVLPAEFPADGHLANKP